MLDQQLRDCPGLCVTQRCVPNVLLGVDIGPLLDQETDHVQAASACGVMEGCLVATTTRVDARTISQQHTRDLDGRGLMEWCVAPRVDPDREPWVCVQELFYVGDVTRLGSRMNSANLVHRAISRSSTLGPIHGPLPGRADSVSAECGV
jgi:hypothetical protein